MGTIIYRSAAELTKEDATTGNVSRLAAQDALSFGQGEIRGSDGIASTVIVAGITDLRSRKSSENDVPRSLRSAFQLRGRRCGTKNKSYWIYSENLGSRIPDEP